jgi:sulfhydrogenase subunit beta (sulfur reductase)
MPCAVDNAALRESLEEHYEHPRWDDVARRCQACGTCTTVCPTCFCCRDDHALDSSGITVERIRRWGSCFDAEPEEQAKLSHDSIRWRYRRWLSHKLASWWDEFGTAGCVGCGRCITWCPSGIDITEEAAAVTRPGQRE